jgi:ZIP family zinc transporter
MVNYIQLLLLGAFAGLTIFLGLPLAALQRVSKTTKGFLNAFAIGILIFLIVDVLIHAWESTASTAAAAFAGKASMSDAVDDLVAMFGGLGLGILSLTWYGSHFMKDTFVRSSLPETNVTGGIGVGQEQEFKLMQQTNAYRLSMMIAVGIGVHNFSEGLAIGQSYASGAIGLALILVVGFAAHNATEGFGIAGPLAGLSTRPSAKFLLLAGLVGGLPTFIGTELGSLWASTLAYVFFLAIAGGALAYVSFLMYNSGRRQVTNNVLMVGIFVGLAAGFLTDLLITLGGA